MKKFNRIFNRITDWIYSLQSSHWLYILVHFIIILGGYIITSIGSEISKSIGTSVTATGITGLIVFLYLFVVQNKAEHLSKLSKFGFIDAFSSRSVTIKGEYTRRINYATSKIDVIGFSLKSMREDFANEFELWQKKAHVRILLIDPEYPSVTESYASQRDKEEGHPLNSMQNDVKTFIQQTKKLINTKNPNLFEVRLYKCLPAINIFRIDDELFWGPYLMGEQSRNTPTFVVKRGGVIFPVFVNHFDQIWNNNELSREIPQDWMN
jgi:hypothetical protein